MKKRTVIAKITPTIIYGFRYSILDFGSGASVAVTPLSVHKLEQLITDLKQVSIGMTVKLRYELRAV